MKKMKRNIINEIESKRTRYNHNEGQVMIFDLKEYEKDLNIIKAELSSHHMFYTLPVVICSAFESFFRAAIKDLIDLKLITMDRVMTIPEIKDYKISILVLKEIADKSISLGELISHLITVQRLNGFNTILSSLLGIDFLSSLKLFSVLTRCSEIIEAENAFKQSCNQILKDIDSAYEIRNISSHEFGFMIHIDKDVLFRYLKNSIIFLEHTNHYLSSLCFPRTQICKKESAVIQAKKNFIKTDQQLNNVLERIIEATHSSPCEMDLFVDSLKDDIHLWKVYRKKAAKSNCQLFIGTKNYYPMYWNNMEWITSEKIRLLEWNNEDMLGDAHRHNNIQKFL